MIKIDLHVHSDASHDSSLTKNELKQSLRHDLDMVAITDHNTISNALKLQSTLNTKRIIVGEEISTKSGDLIGLYLKKVIKPGLSLPETIRQIKAQGGLVYVPHPFEKFQRRGLSERDLLAIVNDIDIFETQNARTISPLARNKTQKFAKTFNLATASASDSHGKLGIGKSYSIISERPSADTLVSLLKQGSHRTGRIPLIAYLEPTITRYRRGKIFKTMRNK